MGELEAFLYGFGASAAVEVFSIYQVYLNEPIVWPARYGRKGFYFVRLLVGVIAGGLAMAQGVESKFAAISIGAAAPLIFEKLSRQEL